MRKTFILFVLLGAFLGTNIQAQQQVWTPDNGNGTFTNPLMWGDWPDPDIIRVGDDFTSFPQVCIMYQVRPLLSQKTW